MENKVTEGNWRFERKFALSTFEFLQFEKQLMLSDIQILYPSRTINNCYLDTTNNNAYEESIEGYSEKMKTRVRWYGDLFGTKTPTLELKIKQNQSNKKELFKLFEVDIQKQMDWDSYAEDVMKYLAETHNFQLNEDLSPVLINTYERAYYTNFRKTFRLTVDSDLQFISPKGVFKKNKPITIERKIIELKFDNSELLTDFPLLSNLGKFSKFTTGIQLLNL
jgi:SPX domain protein involved in polyphosphate accumulation